MKNKTLLLTLLSAAAFAVGCNKEQTTSSPLKKDMQQREKDMKDIKNYTFAQKAEFVTQMQGRVDALNKDLDELSAKIESSPDNVKAQNKPLLPALRNQAAQLNKQLDDARNATESNWDSVKSGFQKTYEATKDGFNLARRGVY